jgi:alpha-N-arabinofuranosidase
MGKSESTKSLQMDKKRLCRILAAAALAGIPLSAVAAVEPPQMPTNRASVLIDTAAPTKTYNRMIFGGFLEHFDNQIYGGVFEPGSPLADKQGFRTDVIEALKELKVSVIRWPGGCFVDSYHWQNGVGKNRQACGDPRWGVVEPNTFGTHEFIELCRRVGAEPYICQNGLASVQEMADWVAYCNATEGEFAELRKSNGHPEPFKVRFWSVGNERYDDAYIRKVRDGAMAMQQVDPSILVTCAGSQDGMKMSSKLLTVAGEHLDYISVHNYWLDRGEQLPRYDYLTAITKSGAPEACIAQVCGSLDEAGRKGRLKVAFDEWNLRAWQHPGFPRDAVKDYDDPGIRKWVEQRRKENDLASQYTMADALFAASFLNACLRHSDRVTMANIAPVVNTRGPLFVHPKGILRRTHFHTLAMYANLLRERVVGTQVTADKLTRGTGSVATVDAIATTDEAGKNWAIALVNRHPSEAVACSVKLRDLVLDGTFQAALLAGDSPDAYNDLKHPGRVAPREVEQTFKKGTTDLPPHSLTIIRVAAK